MIEQDNARKMFESLLEEKERLEQWVKDLQSGMFVNCVYCGHRYGPSEETPVSQAELLTKHVEECPKHPMHVLKQRIRELELENDSLRIEAERYRSQTAQVIARAERAGKIRKAFQTSNEDLHFKLRELQSENRSLQTKLDDMRVRIIKSDSLNRAATILLQLFQQPEAEEALRLLLRDFHIRDDSEDDEDDYCEYDN